MMSGLNVISELFIRAKKQSIDHAILQMLTRTRDQSVDLLRITIGDH